MINRTKTIPFKAGIKYDGAEILDFLNTSRGNNGNRASVYETNLVNHINNQTDIGQLIKNLFRNREGKILVSAEKRGGCNYHHDLLLTFSDQTTARCEVKQYHKPKSVMDLETPWQQAGQYLNGTGDRWRIRHWYARQWYQLVLPWSKTTFNIQTPLPDFEIWFSKDLSCGDAKTDFARQLRDQIKRLGVSGERLMSDKKKEFVKQLHVPEEVKNQLLIDYLHLTNEALSEKDCWLSINGTLPQNFRLWGPIRNDPINSNDLIRQLDSADLMWSYTNPSDGIIRQIRVRFQNRIGVANLSVQCK